MRIIISYESSWRNSFLDGSNNEPLPDKGRNFIGSMTTLKKEGNFKSCFVTKDTVMGVLNRLIGEQRKLYQARQDKNYYFKDIEAHLTEQDIKDYIDSTNDEIVFLRNISGSTDQNAFTGMIKANDPAFTSAFSKSLWGVLFLSVEQVIQFIFNKNSTIETNVPELDPLIVIEQLETLNTLKPITLEGEAAVAYDEIKNKFNDVDFKLTAKQQFTPVSFYTAALYLQLERLQNEYDLSSIVTKSGGLSGISKRGFTKKDFMDRYTTGKKKMIWGNPYILKERRKGEGESIQMLTKATGNLEINLNISKELAQDLKQKISDAGVSAFYLGKKGLAYVKEINI